MGFKEKAGRAFKCALTTISPALNAKVIQYAKSGHWLDLDHPVTFTDKLLALKIRDYNHNPLVKQCADKYAVRQYVSDRGCADLLNDLYGVYDSVDEIDWEQLPQQFAMKWNFGCGMNLICPDKSALDIPAAKKQMRAWGKARYGFEYAELQYRHVERKILVEKYLSPSSGGAPPDYKLYCFHGRCIAIFYIAERDHVPHKGDFFDPDWNFIGHVWIKGKPSSCFVPFDVLPDRPASLPRMLEAAELLSAPFPFVRVDFYDIDSRAVFGEMTFTPAGGHDTAETEIHGRSMSEYL